MMSRIIEKNIKKNIKHTSIIVTLPLMMLFICGPLEIFIGNKDEFNYNIETVLIPFLCIAIVFFVLGVFLLSIIPQKINCILCYIIFIFSILSYIQNIFLNKYLYSRDGSSMDWESIGDYTVRANIVWGVVIFISLTIFIKYSRSDNIAKIIRIVKNFALLLIIIQTVSFISMLVTGVFNRKTINHAILSGNEQYTYGYENNVIILVPDRYTNIEFEALLEENPEVEKDLSDFTYYDNADSCYACTFPSLTHVLSGVDPDISMTRREWFDYAWNSEKCKKFYELLQKNDYNCRLYSSEEASAVFGNLNNLKKYYCNIENAKPRNNYYMLVTLYSKMSLYKYTPYCIKPYFEISSSDAFKDIVVYDNEDGTVDYYNYEVNEGIKNNKVRKDENVKNTFTLMHISGLHERNNDINGNYVEENSVSLDETKAGLALIIREYLENLRERGLYDNATIIIMGDHGKIPSRGIDPQPVFLIKKAGEKHERMQVNSAPISFDDLQATVLTCANIEYDNNLFETNIFEWNENDCRERTISFLDNGFMQYTYTGDRYVVMDMIVNNKGKHTVETHEW